MSIDENNVPGYIYLSLVSVDALNNQRMSEDNVEHHDDAIGIDDNNDDEACYYDAQNVNETQKLNENDADSETRKGNDNSKQNQLVKINNNNNYIGTNDVVIVNDTPNDSNNEPNQDVIAIDNNDNENDKYESVEAMVVTDGSVLTDPSHSTKKKTKTNNIITSPASNLRSKSLPAKRKILPPVKLNYVSTQSTINNSNKRKIVTSSSTPASKKTPPTSITHATSTTLKLPPPTTEKEYSDREMRVFEKEVADALKQHEKDSTNDDLYKQFKATERSFNQKLFRVIPRTSSKANSAVWKSDYCREIHVTAYAEQYFKTGMNYVFHLFHNNTLLTIVL
jgi:hypothetical protein